MKNEREPNKRDTMLKVCRLTYMLIDELVENEEQREDYFKLIDKAIEELQLNED